MADTAPTAGTPTAEPVTILPVSSVPPTSPPLPPGLPSYTQVPLPAGATRPPPATAHKWEFYRSGGTQQVVIKTVEDLFHLDELDQKLWVALSMPVQGVEIDPKTLAFLDADKDGRVRVAEILTAMRWLRETLRQPEELIKGGDTLPIASINPGPVLASAKRILLSLGKTTAETISVADIADSAKIFVETKFNGDGVVHAGSTDDPVIRQAIEDVITVKGSVADRSGKPGINQEKTTAFFTEVETWFAWKVRPRTETALLPAGEGTAAAAAAYAAVKDKVEDHFARCRMVAYDPRAAAMLAGSDADLAPLGVTLLTAQAAELRRLPLTSIAANRPLPLRTGLNPAWAKEIDALRTQAVEPLLGAGKDALTEAEWTSLTDKLAPYTAWVAAKPVVEAEKVGEERLLAMAEGGARKAVEALIVEDLALEAEFQQISSVEKLLLYKRDFFRLCRNFVNFSDFYHLKGAIFQSGSLFLDGRSADLCIDVPDAAKHATLAVLAGTYLVYCDCQRMTTPPPAPAPVPAPVPAPGAPTPAPAPPPAPVIEKKTIVACYTNGDSDALMVGRNGVYYDRLGRDWDAQITKIMANPISLREAFWSPYKKIARLIEEQVAKRAGAAEAKNQQTAATTTQAAVGVVDPKAPPKPPEPPKKIDVGTVAAIGVAVGGIGAMVAGVLAAFFGLGKWMPLGFLAIMLMISLPSMVLAYVKLRHRNLGPLLDASGWAINGQARINVPFGAALTRLSALPAGARLALRDPYAEKQRPWGFYIFAFVFLLTVLLWYVGKIDKYVPPAIRSTKVLGKYAPAYIAKDKPKPEPAPAAKPAAPPAAAPPAAPPAPAMTPPAKK